MESEFFKKFRQHLITDNGVVWIDTESGVKWHLTVSKKEFIEPEQTPDPKSTPEVKKTTGLSTWLKK